MIPGDGNGDGDGGQDDSTPDNVDPPEYDNVDEGNDPSEETRDD